MTKLPPLDEEGVDPLPTRLSKLPSAADRRTGRRTLAWVAMAAAVALVVLLVAGALAADGFRYEPAIPEEGILQKPQERQ